MRRTDRQIFTRRTSEKIPAEGDRKENGGQSTEKLKKSAGNASSGSLKMQKIKRLKKMEKKGRGNVPWQKGR